MEKSESDDGRLFGGIAEIVNRHLGVSDFRTKSSAMSLAKCKPPSFEGSMLLNALFENLRANWEGVVSKGRRASIQNFRWHHPKPDIANRNKSREVTLERALIRACLHHGRNDWSNQVPLISGLVSSHAHKKNAVDLVQALGVNEFEFVELKVSSNTPLYATIEIAIYGFLWLLSRRDRILLGYRDNPILEATSLQLSVLAPRDFYARYTGWDFAQEVNSGLTALAESHGVKMGFRQTAFPVNFIWNPTTNYNELELLAALDNREIV